MPPGEVSALDLWRALDVHGEPVVAWVRPPPGREVAVLLGAFDPPTKAHLAIVRAVARAHGFPGALCLTKQLLDRPPQPLLSDDERVGLLERLASEEGLGLAMANRGTYLEVARAMRAGGLDARFAVGSDKLSGVADPSFYASAGGPAAAFAEARFVVVPRGGAAVERDDVEVLRPEEVFDDPTDAGISASEVRRLVRSGRPVRGMVPPVVAESLEGYTAPEPR